jgi:hypothetical protein
LLRYFVTHGDSQYSNSSAKKRTAATIQHAYCSRSPWNMNKGFNDDEIIEHIIKLRVQAAATIELHEKIHGRIEFCRKYLSLGQRFKVRLAGPFMLIEGRRRAEDRRAKAKAVGS